MDKLAAVGAVVRGSSPRPALPIPAHKGGNMTESEWDAAGYQLLALRQALKLELKGLRRSRGRSAYQTLKDRYGYAGGRQTVLDDFTEDLRDMGVLR